MACLVEDLDLTETLVVALDEVDNIYQANMLERMLRRLDLQEGHDEILAAWQAMLQRMRKTDVNNVAGLLMRRKERAYQASLHALFD